MTRIDSIAISRVKTGRCARSLWLLITLLLSTQVFAQFTASVDRTRIEEVDTLTLTFEAQNASSALTPDFAPVENDFDIVNTRTGSQVSIVNGRMSSVRRWVLTLSPKRRGNLTIGSVTLGSEQSQAITVTVTEPDPRLQAAVDRLVYFETTISNEQVYVQAELKYTVRLFYAADVELYNDMPPPPSPDDAIVLPLGDPRSYATVEQGIRYWVIEQHYALFPQKSGLLTLPPEKISGSIRLPRSYGQRRRGIQIASSGHTVRILAKPSSWPATEPWLPAKAVELVEVWDDEPVQLSAGTSNTRNVVLRAQGQLASLLPELTASRSTQTAKVYADPAETRETANEDGIVSARVLSMAVVPSYGGTFQTDPVVISWFDTEAEQIRQAHLAPRRFDIRGALPPIQGNPQRPLDNFSLSPSGSDTQGSGADANNAYAPGAAHSAAGEQAAYDNRPIVSRWQDLAYWHHPASYLSAALFLLIVLIMIRSRNSLQPLSEAPDSVRQKQADFNALRKQLLQACANQDAGIANTLLPAFCATLLNRSAPEAIAVLRKESADFRESWEAIQKIRYGQDGQRSNSWDSSGLSEWLKAQTSQRHHDGQRTTSRHQRTPVALPPLYPTG